MPKDPVPFKSDHNSPQKRIKSPGERGYVSRRYFPSTNNVKYTDEPTTSSNGLFSPVEAVGDSEKHKTTISTKRMFSSVVHDAVIESSSAKKKPRTKSSSIKTAKDNFNVASTTDCSNLLTLKKVDKGYRNCSFCHIKGHKNQDTSPCPTLSQYGVKLNKKTIQIIQECQKEVFVIPTQGTPMQLLDTLVTEHVIIHSFVVIGSCEENRFNKVSTEHSISDVLTLVTLLDKCIVPIKGCRCILVTINCLMKWINVSKKFSLLIDGRVKWKHRSVVETEPKIIEHMSDATNVDVHCEDSDEELLRKVHNLYQSRSSKLLDLDDHISYLQSDNSSCQLLSINSDDDTNDYYLKNLEAMQKRSRRLTNIDEMLENSSGTDEFYSDDDNYLPTKPYIYIYETSSSLQVIDPVLLTRNRKGFDFKNYSDIESPTQLVDIFSSPKNNLLSWGTSIPKSMDIVQQMSDVMNSRICWCDLRNPEKQNLNDEDFSHLVIHAFFRDTRQDKSMHHLFNEKLSIVTMLKDGGNKIQEYSLIVVRIETIADWIDSHTSKEHLLIDGMDIGIDWAKIRYFSQPQPRCVYSIFSFKLEDNTVMDTVSVADYIAMLQVQLGDVDTSDKDLYWSDRMDIVVPTNVIDIVNRPRAQISPGDTLIYSFKGMFYDTTTLLMSKVMVIDESPPLNFSHLFIKLQNDVYLTMDDIVMIINPKTNEAMSTWLSLGMVKVHEWQKCDVVGGKVVDIGTHLKRKAHRAFIRGCRSGMAK